MKIHHSFKDLRELWIKHSPASVLTQYNFFLSLEESGSIGADAGWLPIIVTDEDAGILYAFLKTHSYAEFIFDWEWARAYEQNGLSYYPKLTSMAPVTPSNTSHFVMKSFDKSAARSLLKTLEEFYHKVDLSSIHFLFVTEPEKSFLEEEGYFVRHSFQYHFTNRYTNFEDFLGNLKTKKAKNLRSERIFTDVTFRRLLGDDLTAEAAQRMHQFYLTTIDKKNSHAYLSDNFFTVLFEKMRDHVLYVEALRNGNVIAGSLFFYDEQRLLGRYWGNFEDVKNLHFELCYYQGMDFCFERNIPLFEAGAQGEHKIPRGFAPITIYSLHKIKHAAFDSAIRNYVHTEKKHVSDIIAELSHMLPFKT